MEELLIKFKTKADNCPTRTKEDRARKGAYVDCVIMLEEFIETYRVSRNILGLNRTNK